MNNVMSMQDDARRRAEQASRDYDRFCRKSAETGQDHGDNSCGSEQSVSLFPDQETIMLLVLALLLLTCGSRYALLLAIIYIALG